MSYEIQAGMVAFGEPLIPSGLPVDPIQEKVYRNGFRVPSKLSKLESRPDLIIRPALDLPRKVIEIIEGGEADPFIEEIMRLDTLGLRTPGISQAREGTVIYDITNRVEGYSFATDLDKIPESIAVSAYEAVLGYYEATLDEGYGVTRRLSDLSLRQLKYGTLDSESQPQTYLVDIDRCLRDPALFPIYPVRNAVHTACDVSALEVAYNTEFPALRERGAASIERALEYADRKGAKIFDVQAKYLLEYLGGYLPYVTQDTHPQIVKRSALVSDDVQ